MPAFPSARWNPSQRRSLVFSLLLVVAVGWVDLVSPALGQSADPSRERLSLKYLPSNVHAVIASHPGRTLKRPDMELFPREIISAGAKQTLGYDPLAVEQSVILMRLPTEIDLDVEFEQAMEAAEIGIVLRFAQPVNVEEILSKRPGSDNMVMIHGVKVFQPKKPSLDTMSMALPDQQTLLFGTGTILKEMLQAHKLAKRAESPMHKRLAAIPGSPDFQTVVLMEPLRPLIKKGVEEALQEIRQEIEVPAEVESFKKIVDLTQVLQLTATISQESQSFRLVLSAEDQQAARELEDFFELAARLANDALEAALASNRAEDPTLIEQANERYARRLLKTALTAVKPTRDGAQLVSQVTIPEGLSQFSALGGLVVPAIAEMRQANTRVRDANSMKMILLAALNHEAARRSFPHDILDETTGKPLLSWRVAILPYLEQGNLYKRFKLDEPWDSEHNKKLLSEMPKIYRASVSKLPADANKTHFLRPTGKGLSKDPQVARLQFPKIRDGSSNTIFAVVVDDQAAVPWTKPADLTIDPKKPKKGLGQIRIRGFQVGMMDGSVQFLKNTIDPKLLYQLFTVNGGEPIDWSVVE